MMGTVADEIERKFVVGGAPDAEPVSEAAQVRQGYLAVDGGAEVRIRWRGDVAVLTVKAGSGLVRTEVELPLGADDADALWPVTAGRRVEKLRQRFALDGGLVAELDTYAGALEGLQTVEVEFESAAAATAFEPPGWFGPEVTGDRRWANATLASEGPPT
jgi:CYTH domain-containing protein